MQIIDCEAAIGLAYWKQKKVYCVEAANFQSKSKGRKRRLESSEEDEDVPSSNKTSSNIACASNNIKSKNEVKIVVVV